MFYLHAHAHACVSRTLHHNRAQLDTDLSVLSNTITDLRDASQQLQAAWEHEKMRNRTLQDTVSVREAQREQSQREVRTSVVVNDHLAARCSCVSMFLVTARVTCALMCPCSIFPCVRAVLVCCCC